jgi:hypothetical protein
MTTIAQLKKIERELSKIAQGCSPRGKQKIAPTNAFQIAMLSTGIMESIACILGEARQIQQPNKVGIKARLVKKTRATLGYLYP